MVLLLVSFVGATFPSDYDKFVKWLGRDIPDDEFGAVSVKGVFNARLTIQCLLAVPAAVWLALPDHDCFTFVAHTTPNDLIKKTPITIGAPVLHWRAEESALPRVRSGIMSRESLEASSCIDGQR